MRLTTQQLNTIVDTSRAVAGQKTLVWLFGSRLDDTRYGGDIDLLIEPSSAVTLLQRARIKMLLEEKLNLPVDILVKNPDNEAHAFIAMVRPQAKLLEMTS